MDSMAIKGIVVRRLFGAYDYDLYPPDESSNPDRLIILYGDNGSGKTTILRMLFHLLAPDIGQAHKTTLGTFPFSRFDVYFTSGAHVWAQRPKGKLTGSFTMGLSYGKGKQHTADFRLDEDGDMRPSPAYRPFMTRLGTLDVRLYFLSDDRSVRLAGLEGPDLEFIHGEIPEDEIVALDDPRVRFVRRRGPSKPKQQASQILAQSLRTAGQWIQSQAVRGASRGELSVNSLYAEILKHIARMPLEKDADKSTAVEKLGQRLAKLESRSREYSKYGLQPEFTGKDILAIVKSAPPSHVTVITTALTPYIDSVEKKLDEMERLQKQVDALVRLLNSFYTRKQISYEIHEGFRISTQDGKPLQPEMLSSGERHLLLLFCNTVQTLDRPTIFIIDEPEISLNIKWQRRLIAALLECAGENPVQYLFATHSFELLAQYGDNVIKLEHVSD